MSEIKAAYKPSVTEAIDQIQAWLQAHPGVRGVSAQVAILNAGGAGFNTLGGKFLMTGTDVCGRRVPTQTYPSLSAAWIAWCVRGYNYQRLWHEDAAGKRHLVIG